MQHEKELYLVSHHQERVWELKRVLHELIPTVHLVPMVDNAETVFDRASEAVARLGKPCLVDVSVLRIPFLGKEFVEKRAHSGVFVPDTQKILSCLQGVDEGAREAFLECTLSFASPEHGLIRTVTCRMEGFIADRPRGSSTFDFASIFIKHEYNKTLAELSPSVQSRISHRRKACEKLLPFFRSYFGRGAVKTPEEHLP